MPKTKGDLLFKGCRTLIAAQLGPEKADAVMQKAYQRYAQLLEENKDEPKAMDPHTKARIYPAISVFEALLQAGFTRQQAAQVLYDFYDTSAAKGAKFLQALLKIPSLYKKVPGFASNMLDKSYGAAAGFSSVRHRVDETGMHIDVTACPYNEICCRYGCPEIVQAFCHSDDVAYGHRHPKLDWARTQTRGRGGDCCDFIINVKK